MLPSLDESEFHDGGFRLCHHPPYITEMWIMVPDNLFVHVPHLKERTDVAHNRVFYIARDAHFKSTSHMVDKNISTIKKSYK